MQQKREMTRRERDCAELLLEGYHEKDMAKELGISPRTVKQYMKGLYQKYGILGGVKYVKLAVALYYERNPEKRIPTNFQLSPTERFILLRGQL
jgi:DNA-binding CsgD family transcriptional regulator